MGKSHQLVLDTYSLLRSYPKDEKMNLISQMKRSSTSIPTNIAEGAGMENKKELCSFSYHCTRFSF